MDTLTLTITGFVVGASVGSTLAACGWARHHAAVLRQTRADHQWQMSALFGQRDAARVGVTRRWRAAGRIRRTRQDLHVN